jgi:hypothetical protein
MMKNYKLRLKTGLLLIFAMLALSYETYGQVSAFAFTQSAGTYTPIAGGTVLGGFSNDDNSYTNLPIGFTFNFNGTDYTAFSVNNNGFIRMGTAIASDYSTLNTSANNNAIAALNRDLQGNGTTSELSYSTTGAAPNRTLVVQWKNYKKYGANGTGDDYNFQIILHEYSKVIEISYGAFVSNANDGLPQVGLRGASNADFNDRTGSWAATTAGATNAATMLVNPTSLPADGTLFQWTQPPPAPPVPTQDPAAPTCSGGTTLDLTGSTAPTNVSWYWQTSATGTSTAVPYAGPYTVFANGTYYARAFNSTANLWSLTSSSIVVSNFPLATAPPAPVAGINPSCAPTGTTLTEAAAPAGYNYFWQGTVNGGSSNAQPATAPYAVTTTGTYYVAAFETATGCWSNTTGLLVTVDTYIPPAPTAEVADFNACMGATNIPVSATLPPATGSVVINFASGFVLNPGTSTLNGTLTLPAGATITSSVMTFNGVTTTGSTFMNDMSFSMSGAATQPTTIFPGNAATNGGPYNYNPTTSPAGGPVTLNMTNNWFSPSTFNIVTLTVNYSLPASVINWYNASTAGTNVGTGTPFETVGTSILPNTSTEGDFVFYAGSTAGGCSSTSRTAITVHVTDVLATLTPVNVTCNGGNNGSFMLGSVACGTAPFTYAVNGGPFGPIPSNLEAGTYSIVIRDASLNTSPLIPIVLTEPGAPINLAVDAANYFTADISWTAVGNETQWEIEYGTPGFTPGTGTFIGRDTSINTVYTLTGLTANTTYAVYIRAICGDSSLFGGPLTLNTDPGFLASDNQCGPGFTDIFGTGTLNTLGDDDEVGTTIPFPFLYQGTSYTDITIGNNGAIVFGTLTAQIGFTNGTMAAAATGLYPFWDDMGGSGAGVFYQTIGTAPNRQFIVQWNKEHLSTSGNQLSYQLILEEASNDIYFLYDDVLVGNATIDYGASATIGVAGPNTDIQVSMNSATYLQNNSCAHFYNALCPNPVSPTAMIYQEEILLDWSTGLYGETMWTLIYGTAGFDPVTGVGMIGTLDSLTNSDADITGLTQLTDYDFYIYSECQLDDLTSPGLLLTYQTLPWCANPTAVLTSTDVDSLYTSWTFTAADPLYTPTGFNLQYGMTGFDIHSIDAWADTADANLTDTLYNPALLAGGVYQVYVQAVCGEDTSNYAGPFTFTMPISNDSVCGEEELMVDGTVYVFSNIGATVTSGETAIAPPNTGLQTTTGWGNSSLTYTTWFTFEAPSTGKVRISGVDRGFNGQAAVYEVNNCSDYTSFTLLAANDNDVNGGSLAPNFTVCGLTPGNTYYLMHDAFSTTTPGIYSLKMTEIDLEAGSTSPMLTMCAGDTVDLFNGINGNDAGGTWIDPINTGRLTGSSFASLGLAFQVFNFEYRVTDGCAYDSLVSQVEIFGPSHAGTDGTITVCKNQPINLLAGLSGIIDLSGVWYDPSDMPMPTGYVSAANFAGSYNYDYVAGNGVCPDDTSLVIVNVLNNCDYLDVKELELEGFNLYPNPTDGLVYITNEGSSEVFNFEVTDMNGRLISTSNHTISGSATTEVDLRQAQTGMYLIRVFNAGGEKTFRVIVK